MIAHDIVNPESQPAVSSEIVVEQLFSNVSIIQQTPVQAREKKLPVQHSDSLQEPSLPLILNTFTQLYVKYGNWDNPEELSRRLTLALELSDALQHQVNDEVASAWTQLGTALRNEGKYDESIVQYQRSLKVYQSLKGKYGFNAMILNNVLGDLYYRKGTFDEAIDYYVEALALWETVDRSLLLVKDFQQRILSRLAGATYQKLQNVSGPFLEKIIEALPQSGAIRSKFYNNLGDRLRAGFEATGSHQDLYGAISVSEALVIADPPRGVEHLKRLIIELQMRFQTTRSPNYLDEAAALAEKGIAKFPRHPDQELFMNYLAAILWSRFELTGNVEDLYRAVATAENAVSVTSSDNPQLPIFLSNLAGAYQGRFERTGSLGDLDRAIKANMQAIDIAPLTHPLHDLLLNNLSNALQRRFEVTGSLEDLDRAIDILDNILSRDDTNAVIMNNLCAVLQRRFERTGSMKDLDRAISIESTLVGPFAKDESDYPNHSRINNLGAALLKRAERTGSHDDLDRAVSMIERALKSVPPNHPNRSVYLYNSGKSLLTRFTRNNDLQDLDCAIESYTLAISLAPPEHPNVAMYLNSLGNALQSRYTQVGSIEDLDRAIQFKQQAVSSTPSGHPEAAVRLDDLGNAFLYRFKLSSDLNDLNAAVAAWEEAFHNVAAAPSVRIRAAESASRLLQSSDPYRANPLLRGAVELLPLLSPRNLQESDREHNISQFAGIASRAVSISLECGDPPSYALQLLELGRGVLASLQLETRSDISALYQISPELAQRFHDIREGLDSTSESTLEEPAKRSLDRHHLSEFYSLLDQIRQLPGFERFLLSPSISDMSLLARHGPIVVFNVSEIRSDAFLIEVHGVRSIQLFALSHAKLEFYTSLFLKATKFDTKSYDEAKINMTSVLEWLWDTAVDPVLESLGLAETPSADDVWPRVWWVGSGLLGLLPIHAAGYHDSNRNALDRVISSYTPTVKALAYAQQRASHVAPRKPQHVALIGMPTTPHFKNLPFVRTEIAMVRDVIPSSIDVTVMLNPTRQAVISALHENQFVHLACHSRLEGSRLKLFLSDWEVRPLTITDICTIKAEFAQLAYLSCNNAATTRDFSLIDESINLSSAVQLAGYPSVVGTLWGVMDEESTQVARDVYYWMGKGGEFLDHWRAAEGLHWAVRSVRSRTRRVPGFKKPVPSDPLVWASYIYCGA